MAKRAMDNINNPLNQYKQSLPGQIARIAMKTAKDIVMDKQHDAADTDKKIENGKGLMLGNAAAYRNLRLFPREYEMPMAKTEEPKVDIVKEKVDDLKRVLNTKKMTPVEEKMEDVVESMEKKPNGKLKKKDMVQALKALSV
jgi:hypothetical protein